jgi:hypothetical protein
MSNARAAWCSAMAVCQGVSLATRCGNVRCENLRRPAFVLEQVNGAVFQHVKAQKAPEIPTFVLKNVENFDAHYCRPIPDVHVAKTNRREF